MAHRTDLSQPDEGLRRVRGDQPTETCQRLLLQAGAYLQAAEPTRAMWESVVDYLAGRLAGECFGDDRAMVAEARRQFRAQAPEVRAGETRGEYGMRLEALAKA